MVMALITYHLSNVSNLHLILGNLLLLVRNLGSMWVRGLGHQDLGLGLGSQVLVNITGYCNMGSTAESKPAYSTARSQKKKRKNGTETNNKVSYRKHIARQLSRRPRKMFLTCRTITAAQNLVVVSYTMCAHVGEVPKFWGTEAPPLWDGGACP